MGTSLIKQRGYINPAVLTRRWSPLNLQNKWAWWRQSTGIAGTTNASAWADSFGLGHGLTAVGGAQPAITPGALLFDGTAHYMQTISDGLIQPFGVILFAKQITFLHADNIFNGITVNGGALYQEGVTPNVRPFAGVNGGVNSEWVLNTYAMVVCVIDGANTSLTVNNGASAGGNPGAGNPGGLTLGANLTPGFFSNIQVREGIVVSGTIDFATRAKLFTYGQRKGLLV